MCTVHRVEINSLKQPYRHYNIYTTDAYNLLLHVRICVNLPEDGTHGVPKHVGESVLSLLCIYSSVRKPHCVSFTKFIIRDLRFSCAWLPNLRSSEIWRRVVSWTDTNVSGLPFASFSYATFNNYTPSCSASRPRTPVMSALDNFQCPLIY